ncbi:MAG: DUF4097 domain-containing protein [Spirochaetaceae bacterium]|nr:DUF4097 domain-containing protein [Spirochaetaceae bacterium]
MKLKNLLITLSLFIAFASAYGSGAMDAELVNTQQIRLDSVESVEVHYFADDITIFQGTSEYLELREYMTEKNKRYYADIRETGNQVFIESGNRPELHFGTFHSYVEIYLPAFYRGDLSVEIASGDLESSDSFTFAKGTFKVSSGDLFFSAIQAQILSFETNSGQIAADWISAENISVDADSVEVTIGKAEGNMNIQVNSGEITVGELRGAVNARINSGSIECTVADLSGNIDLAARSGSVHLTLPRPSEFAFSAKAESGRISTPFEEYLTGKPRDLSGKVGNSDTIRVDLETTSGNIEVDW